MFLICCWAVLLLFSCPLAFQTAIFPTSLLPQTPLQVCAVEREKLPSFSLSVKASVRVLRDEACPSPYLVSSWALNRTRGVPGVLPGHWGSEPEGQVSFESFVSFSPVHDRRPTTFVSLPLGSPHSLSILVQKTYSVLLFFLCLFRAKARER